MKYHRQALNALRKLLGKECPDFGTQEYLTMWAEEDLRTPDYWLIMYAAIRADSDEECWDKIGSVVYAICAFGASMEDVDGEAIEDSDMELMRVKRCLN